MRIRINEVLLKEKKVGEIIKLLDKGQNVSVEGLTGSRFSFFAANLLSHLNRDVLILAEDNYQLDQYYEDLIRLIPEDNILVFPETEVLPHEQIVPDLMEISDRLQVLQELSFDHKQKVVITTGTALIYKLMPAHYFHDYSLYLAIGKEIDLKELAKRLSLLGYERVDMVEGAGQFSVRGGIVDIYTLTGEAPYRLEFFGDEVDSIRLFDTDTQRSERDVEEIIIPPARELILFPEKIQEVIPEIKEDYEQAIFNLKQAGNKNEAEYLAERKNEALEKLTEFNEFPGYEQFLPYFYDNPNSLLDYLQENTLIFFGQTSKIWRRIKKQDRELAETQASLLEQGSILPTYSENFFNPHEIKNKLNRYTSLFAEIELKDSILINKDKKFAFQTRGIEPYHGQLDMLAERVEELYHANYKLFITLNSTSKARRIAEFLQEKKLPAIYSKGDFKEKEKIIVIDGTLAEGFMFEDMSLVLFSEKEVMGKPRRKKRKMREIEDGVKISSLNELTVGDYVVHENHGIGKYLGVKTMEIQGQHQDYLVLKYAGEDKLYVPTEQVNLVQKYIGADQNSPKLYKLGGNDWKKVKQRVKESVQDMAIGLLELYAERETIKGHAFSEDTVWQKEFEEAFPYEETPDQKKAIREVKKDMESETPMDRLLCGDVGYGKTEVAIRAAFKAVMDSKQTAVLVPTTILAQQHYNTFTERMENYPVNIEMISRFKTQAEQRKILKDLATGKVDIIIGTHRLLSKDVIFHDLGLLIIDEEQRFGVSHKERLKDFKRNVDVLTLTATPIPRTLHMALVGVRDMSVIETPPENRYPIRTYIREFNRDLIRDAIRKEISRGGQIYFVHNRVEDIDEKAEMIRKIIPEARVAVAHGQMNERRLEKLMYNFYNKEYDVLVCTTIIETGLDIPNVNTIIINRADQMGLAQLYQLRGRVGRSNRIAYAYLLYERDRILPEVAEKRLRAIKEFTNLGSGFKIAMRDLEIRGAGNLLGPEQHGHIASVGFSLYCKLLENAVEELKGRKKEEDYEVEVDVNLDAYLPDSYITDSRQKIEIYKKIMALKHERYFPDIIDELIDRFGDPPQPVVNLLNLTRLKIKTKRLGVEKITEEKGRIYFHFKENNRVDGETVFELIEKYPRKIKIRSGRKPVLGIKVGSPLQKGLKFAERIADMLLEKGSK